MQGGSWLKKHEVDLFLRYRAMLHTLWNNNKLALLYVNYLIAQLHLKGAFYDQEHFIFLFVAVPDKLALDLGQLHLLPV